MVHESVYKDRSRNIWHSSALDRGVTISRSNWHPGGPGYHLPTPKFCVSYTDTFFVYLSWDLAAPLFSEAGLVVGKERVVGSDTLCLDSCDELIETSVEIQELQNNRYSATYTKHITECIDIIEMQGKVLNFQQLSLPKGLKGAFDGGLRKRVVTAVYEKLSTLLNNSFDTDTKGIHITNLANLVNPLPLVKQEIVVGDPIHGVGSKQFAYKASKDLYDGWWNRMQAGHYAESLEDFFGEKLILVLQDWVNS